MAMFLPSVPSCIGTKDNMGGGGGEMVTKLKASTLHPSLFDKDW